MTERFEIVEKAIITMLEDKKYTALRDLFLTGLDQAGIPHTTPQGAYYVLADISEFGYKSDLEFCEVLAEKCGVGAVPGSSFFREEICSRLVSWVSLVAAIRVSRE